MYRIKTFNKISIKGLGRFSREKYEVAGDLSEPDAYLLRSHKLHGEPLPPTVQAIARAGAGVNNIPVADLTGSGVVVFNTPGANANAVKELVLVGLLLGSRGITSGIDYVQSLTHMTDAGEMSKLLEKEKSRFAGNELYGKSLGVVGLGAIGSMVAEMALSLGMNVMGYDPALSVEAAWRLPSQVQRMGNLQSLLSKSDYITLHVPAIEATQHLINTTALNSVKTGAVLVNFARDAIVDPEAIVASLDKGNSGLAQYVCDFPEPCLLNRADVIAMPHIGASTAEAEENCALMAADQLKDFLENGNIKNSVNYPVAIMERDGEYRITFSNENVAGVLGDVLSVLATNDVNVVDMINKSRADIAYNIIDVAVKPDESVLAAIAAVKHVVRVRGIG